MIGCDCQRCVEYHRKLGITIKKKHYDMAQTSNRGNLVR